MSRDSRGRLRPSYTEQFDESNRSSRSRSGGMPSRSQGGVPLVSPPPGESEDYGPPYTASVLDMEDETTDLPSSSIDLPREEQPATDSAIVQSPRPKKVKKAKKKARKPEEGINGDVEVIIPRLPTIVVEETEAKAVPKTTACEPSEKVEMVEWNKRGEEETLPSTGEEKSLRSPSLLVPPKSKKPAGHKREGRIHQDAATFAAVSPLTPAHAGFGVGSSPPPTTSLPLQGRILIVPTMPAAVAPSGGVLGSPLQDDQSGTMRELTGASWDEGEETPPGGGSNPSLDFPMSPRFYGDANVEEGDGMDQDSPSSPPSPTATLTGSRVLPGRPPTSPSPSVVASPLRSGHSRVVSFPPPSAPHQLVSAPPLGATVNGQPMPTLVPRDHLLIFFPKGIFGLHNQTTREPVSLDSYSGNLVLTAGQNYILPSASAPIVTGAESLMGTTGRNGSSRSGGEFRNPTPDVLSEDSGGEMRRESSNASRLRALVVGSHDRKNIGRDNRSTRSGVGGGGDDKSSDGGILPNIGLFRKVKDIDAPDNCGDPATRLMWLKERKKSLIISFIGVMLCTLAMITGTIFDRWLSCESTYLGMWKTCVESITYISNSSTEQITTPYEICVPSETASECQNPNWRQLIPLMISIDIFMSIYTVIMFVDVVLQVTPRRPFYALFSLATWSMLTALWSQVLNGVVTPVKGSETRVECSMRQSFVENLDPTTLPLNSNNLREYPSQSRCALGFSFWHALGSWILWTLVMMWYFYMRWRSWSKWGSKNLAAEPVAVVGGGSGSRRGSVLSHDQDADFSGPPPPVIAGGSTRPVRGHARTDSNSSLVMARLASDTILAFSAADGRRSSQAEF